MVGPWAYDRLVDYVESRDGNRKTERFLPHPALRRH